MLLDYLVRFPVSVFQRIQTLQKPKKTLLLRRPSAFEIRMSRHDFRFIQRDPKLHLFAESHGKLFCVSFKIFREFFGENSSLITKPQGESPMPESDERFDIAFDESADNLLVVFHG